MGTGLVTRTSRLSSARSVSPRVGPFPQPRSEHVLPPEPRRATVRQLRIREQHVLEDLARTQRHLAAIEQKIATYRAIVEKGTPANADTTAR